MAPKLITCEFCHVDSRKDAIAGHVKSKHMIEMGKRFLKEAIDKNGGYCDLARYFQHKNATPLYSSIDEEACYIFGVQPKYFEEKDSFGPYLASQDNVDAHNKFVEDCIATLNATDILPIIDIFQFKSPDVSVLKKKSNETIQELQKKIQDMEKDFERLQRENMALSACCDVDIEEYEQMMKTHEKMKRDITYYERTVKDTNMTINRLNDRLKKYEEDENYTLEKARMATNTLELKYQDLMDMYMKLKGKKSDKKAKEKEKRKKEKKKQKKKLKDLESDSDSDSDSD